MSVTALDDIESLSNKLAPWRRDCLRRLAMSDDLCDDDLAELLAMIRSTAGIEVAMSPPAAVPFTKAHFRGCKRTPIILKGIANVQNVNRLLADASLNFCPKSLTIVYGRNGSGKSGFVRILRTACRTRVENPAKLKVLANVYRLGSKAQSADIIVDAGAGDTVIRWTPGMVADPLLAQVAVFDELSAQLYVDGGNQIRYLPFGLALPHRLNSISLILKEKLETERATVVGDKLKLTAIAFPAPRATEAQQFAQSVAAETTDASIDAVASFAEEDEKRLAEIARILTAGTAAVADISTLVSWVDAIKLECNAAISALGDTALAGLTDLRAKAAVAREAAAVAADELFTDEPLQGVGSETWRALWTAARDYSVAEAYPGQSFPVAALDDGEAVCVLCQQPLQAGGASRMDRFRKYMDDTLDAAANKAEQAVRSAEAGLPALDKLDAEDFADRLKQVRARDATLANCLTSFQKAALGRRVEAVRRLMGNPSQPVTEFLSPVTAIEMLASKLKTEKETLSQAGKSEERQKLIDEKAELEDRKTLAANKTKLTTRRDLLVKQAAYSKCLSEKMLNQMNHL